MKLHLLISQQRVEEAIVQMTVGEKLLFLRAKSRAWQYAILWRVLCDIDNKPISFFFSGKTYSQCTVRQRPERGILVCGRKIMGLAVPRIRQRIINAS